MLGSPLVIYLAQDLHLRQLGLSVGLLLAAPYLVGVLRVIAPAAIGRLASRKSFCIAMYLASGAVLAIVPGVAAFGHRLTDRASLALLVSAWCGYHLLEFLASVALWSWLADLCPQPARGHFFGTRERWMALAQAIAMLASGLYVWGWTEMHAQSPRWMAYVVPASYGVCALIAAVVPLMIMPASRDINSMHDARINLSKLLEPLFDRRFLAVTGVFCWFSFVNGMISSPQNLFPNQVLKLGLFAMLALKVGTRLGQWPLGPTIGRIADRYGNVPVLVVSYAIIAHAPIFYFLATPSHPWWIVSAWICWIAWLGPNIGMPKLVLETAPRESNASYIALFYAATGLCHGLSTLLGGVLFDRFAKAFHFKIFHFDYGGWNYYQTAFLLAWAGYIPGVGLLLVMLRHDIPCQNGSVATIFSRKR